MNVLCVIPARGGSKGLKNKNILKLGDKPLIGYSIESALKAKNLNKIVVSTDSKDIADAVKALYDIDVIMRPEDISKDDSPIEEALLHAVEYEKNNNNFPADIVVWLQANIPFRKDGVIDEAVKKLIEDDSADSCVTCYEVDQMPEAMKIIDDKGRLQPVVDDVKSIRRQEFKTRYILDGAVLAIRAKNLYKTKGVRKLHVYLGKEIIPIIENNAIYNLEIDDSNDWELAQYYFEKHKKDFCG